MNFEGLRKVRERMAGLPARRIEMNNVGRLAPRWLILRELRGCIATWSADISLRQVGQRLNLINHDVFELADAFLQIDEDRGEDLLYFPPMAHLMDKEDALWWIDLWLERWPEYSQDPHPMSKTIPLMDALRQRLADRKLGVAGPARSGPVGA